MNYTGYIPVPVWTGSHWEPRNYAGPSVGPDVIPWPDGFNPSQLPTPPVQLHQRVHFRFGTQRMVGEITEIKLSGGVIYAHQDETTEIRQRYAFDRIHLTIYADGHGQYVPLRDVIAS